jgi:hypothetical protein
MRTIARPSYGAPRPAVKTTYTPRPTVKTKQKTKYDDSSASKNYGQSSAQRNYQTKKNVTPSRAPTKAAPRKSATDHLADSQRKSAAQAKQVEENRARQKAGMDYQKEKTKVNMSQSPSYRQFWEGDGATYNARGTQTHLQRFATETSSYDKSTSKSGGNKTKKYDAGWDAYNQALREMRFRVNKTVRKKRDRDLNARVNKGGLGGSRTSGTQRKTLALTAKALRDEE